MKEWGGEFELEKKGNDLRLAARGLPALLIVLLIAGVTLYRLLA